MYCLDVAYIFLNSNQFHSMPYTGYIFTFLLSLISAVVWADVYWAYLHASEKPKIFCIKLKFFQTSCESRHMFVDSCFFVAKFEALTSSWCILPYGEIVSSQNI